VVGLPTNFIASLRGCEELKRDPLIKKPTITTTTTSTTTTFAQQIHPYTASAE
jgi:hypothetical protein